MRPKQASAHRLVHADMVNYEMSRHPDGGSRPNCDIPKGVTRSNPVTEMHNQGRKEQIYYRA